MSETSGGELSPYARIVADIRARIEAGQLRAGDRVPSTREITREWGVAMATATKALSALRHEGVVDAVRGVGTVVRGTPTPEPAGPPKSRIPKPPEEHPPATVGGRGRNEPEATLNRKAVVRAAIAVADVEGISGLSMRRVSTELRVSTMALYRHVENKDELVSAMLDEVYMEAALPERPPADWREAMELVLWREWGIFRGHPWAARLASVARVVLSPGFMAYGEWMMSVFTARGHSPDSALAIVTVLSAYTSGMAVQTMRYVAEESESELDAERWQAAKGEKLIELMTQGRFPNVLKVSGLPDTDETFALGMRLLLDGLAPLVASAEDQRRS